MPGPSTNTTGLAPGRYLALTTAQLKGLRATKGDPARRDHTRQLAASGGCDALDVGDAWFFLNWLGGADVACGRALHKGQMTRIELLDPAKLAAALVKLGALDLKAAFFAIDEQAFRYSNVAFWVAEQWQKEGRKTVLDDHVFARVEHALGSLAPFVAKATASDKDVLFMTSF